MYGISKPRASLITGNIVELIETFDVDAAYTTEKLLTDMYKAGIDKAVVVDHPSASGPITGTPSK